MDGKSVERVNLTINDSLYDVNSKQIGKNKRRSEKNLMMIKKTFFPTSFSHQ